jgi:hypothetical protein
MLPGRMAVAEPPLPEAVGLEVRRASDHAARISRSFRDRSWPRTDLTSRALLRGSINGARDRWLFIVD